MDLGARRYETFDDLYEYCIRVASAVGLICLEIFGYRDPGARQYAIDLGVALQLTNILRDVPEDLRRGRVYIPQEDLRAHGVHRGGLTAERTTRRRVQSPTVKALLRQQAARARDYSRAPRASCRARTRGGSSRRRSWARSTARSSIASSSATTTSSRRVVRVPRPRRALIAATTWAGGHR